MPVVFVRGKQKAWSPPKPLEKETPIPSFKVKYDLKTIPAQNMEIYDVARVVEPPSGYTLGAAPAPRVIEMPELLPESPISTTPEIPSPRRRRASQELPNTRRPLPPLPLQGLFIPPRLDNPRRRASQELLNTRRGQPPLQALFIPPSIGNIEVPVAVSPLPQYEYPPGYENLEQFTRQERPPKRKASTELVNKRKGKAPENLKQKPSQEIPSKRKASNELVNKRKGKAPESLKQFPRQEIPSKRKATTELVNQRKGKGPSKAPLRIDTNVRKVKGPRAPTKTTFPEIDKSNVTAANITSQKRTRRK